MQTLSQLRQRNRFAPAARHRYARTLFIIVLGMTMVFVWRLFDLYQQKVARTEALAASIITDVERRFRAADSLSDAHKQELRRFLNPVHLKYARRFGIERLESREQAARLVSKGELVGLASAPHYYVSRMTYSVPVVVEPAANALDLIGVRFQQALREHGLPTYRFIITSGARTTEDQNALRRANSNAAGVSSHEFATSVDILYDGFDAVPAQIAAADSLDVFEDMLLDRLTLAFAALGTVYQPQLKGLLGRVLLELQQEGRLAVIYERRQPVFHVTVADEVAPPAPEDWPSLALSLPEHLSGESGDLPDHHLD